MATSKSAFTRILILAAMRVSHALVVTIVSSLAKETLAKVHLGGMSHHQLFGRSLASVTGTEADCVPVSSDN